MGLFDGLNLGDSLKGVLGQVGAAAAPMVINALLQKTQLGDLNGLVNKLQQGGLGTQVQSWLGNGANMPVSADQLRSVLGDAQVQEFARHLGLPVDEALKMLSEHLPGVVDQASPNGRLQPAA
jgi:uncharacterized protein YidB (DUF937 family)